MATIASVAGLFVYPLKSARGIARQRARLTATGFQWDRQWMLINPGGTFLSQRTHPQLARIVPEITAESLTLRAPGQSELRLPMTADGERRAVRVHRDSCIGLEQDRVADEWLSRAHDLGYDDRAADKVD